MTHADRMVILTDGNQKIGLGHVMRELQIARFLKRLGYAVTFITFSAISDDIIRAAGFTSIRVEGLTELFERLQRTSPSRLVVDLHERDLVHMQSEENLRRYLVTVVLSPVGYEFAGFGRMVFSIGTDLDQHENVRKVESDGIGLDWYSGRAYIPFRDEFLELPDKKVRIQANKVLICMGGSDPCRLTQQCMDALDRIDRTLDCRVVIGRAMTTKTEIVERASKSKHRYEALEDIDYMAEVMLDSDLAMISGGNVRYELCMTGTPYVALSMNTTQFACTQQLTNLGVGLNLGVGAEIPTDDVSAAVVALLPDYRRRYEMSHVMRGLFDGHGIERIVSRMLDSAAGDLS